jgi:hypothetical protein
MRGCAGGVKGRLKKKQRKRNGRVFACDDEVG